MGIIQMLTPRRKKVIPFWNREGVPGMMEFTCEQSKYTSVSQYNMDSSWAHYTKLGWKNEGQTDRNTASLHLSDSKKQFIRYYYIEKLSLDKALTEETMRYDNQG